MKKNELTHIIKEIVAEEIRKELPNAIAEVFQNFMGKKAPISKQVVNTKQVASTEDDDAISLKQSMQEMFSGNIPIPKPQLTAAQRQFTKNPVLNEILNSTRPFSPQERTGASLGMAGMLASAQADFGSYQTPTIDPGIVNAPISQTELMRDTHVPLSNIPSGASVMDIKHHAPPVVAKALTRNYSQMMKLIDQKRGKG